MGKIPEGLQEHALYRMDGRIWIEPFFPSDDPKKQKLTALKIEKGWMQLIPNEELQAFVSRL